MAAAVRALASQKGLTAQRGSLDQGRGQSTSVSAKCSKSPLLSKVGWKKGRGRGRGWLCWVVGREHQGRTLRVVQEG